MFRYCDGVLRLCGVGFLEMKRVLHYLILAAILLGVPALCAWLGGYDEIWEGVKSFPPRTEDWGFHPEKLWNYRRPFRWGAFIGLMAFTAWCLWPFVKRAVRVAVIPPRPSGALPLSQGESLICHPKLCDITKRIKG